jgi:hypothetical protein
VTPVSLWWLTYRENGQVKVIIVEATALISARMSVALAGLDRAATFAEGHELDDAHAAHVPQRQIGRMMGRKEAVTLLDRIERKRR